jgi:prefoldin subunit 5
MSVSHPAKGNVSMLSREEVEQMINQKIEPLTEEIAALKAQPGKVDLLAIDTRNIRQSPGHLETTQNSLQLDFERQEKRLIRFEKQTNDQLTDMQADMTAIDGKVVGLQTEMHQRFTTVETQLTEHTTLLTEHTTLLTEILARLPKPE